MSQIFPVADRIGETETSNLLGERAAERHVDKGRFGRRPPCCCHRARGRTAAPTSPRCDKGATGRVRLSYPDVKSATYLVQIPVRVRVWALQTGDTHAQCRSANLAQISTWLSLTGPPATAVRS